MKSDTKHHRKSFRIPAYDYAGPGAYFVTIVTRDHLCILGHIEEEQMALSPRGRIAEDCWCAIPEHFPNVELGAYVFMPNHVHGIVIIHDRADEAPDGNDHAADSPPHGGATECDHGNNRADASSARTGTPRVPLRFAPGTRGVPLPCLPATLSSNSAGR